MIHEPECANYGENTLAWPCVCDVIRAAYQRGVAVNADAIQRIRELHKSNYEWADLYLCAHCGVTYPCETLQMLEGVHE